MEALSFDKISLITIFFVPGFVYLKSNKLLFPEVISDFSKDLYEAIGFSFINAIFSYYPLHFLHSINFHINYKFLYYIIILVFIIILPILYSLIFFYISQHKWFSRFIVHPTKSAWDSFFSKRESYYVIVTLKNGQKIGGKYGLNSFSSTYPNPKEIYLEEVWKLNDQNGFDEIVERTEGILITENEISTIEFYI